MGETFQKTQGCAHGTSLCAYLNKHACVTPVIFVTVALSVSGAIQKNVYYVQMRTLPCHISDVRR